MNKTERSATLLPAVGAQVERGVMQHTPGPWRTVDDAQGPCMVLHPTLPGVAIANLGVCFNPTNGFHEGEMRERNANARLIAAAPQQHDALLAVRHAPNWRWLDDATQNAVRAALAAASAA